MARDQGAYPTRRNFCRTLAGVLVAPGIALAQAPNVVRRIGVLSPGVPNTPEEIRQQGEALGELGWVEGRNLRVERRYSNNQIEPLQSLADELVRAKVELIVTLGFSATLAAKRATTTIPIVFRDIYDAVASGLVANLARPGSNLTGFSDAGPEVAAKYLAVLKELLPLQRVAVIRLPTPLWRATREQYAHSCRSLGIEPIFVEVAAANEISGAIARVAQQRPQTLVLRADSFVFTHRFEIIDAAMKHGLPTMAEDPVIVRAVGALLSYSPSLAEEDKRVVSYIDRILRGAKPGDLPVEQPTKFELVINLKTARALGVAVPQSLLLRADEVIQ